MERWTFESQSTATPVDGRADNLYEPVGDDGGERGRNWSGHTRKSSLYTSAFLHPRAAATATLLGLAALATGVVLARVATTGTGRSG
jgi:hypothetical protein